MKKENLAYKIGHVYNNIEEYLLVGSLVFNVLLVFIQVVMRTVFKDSLSWSEELSRYIFMWQIWLGTSIALREKEHIRVTLIFEFIKKDRIKACIALIADVCWFAFCTFLVWNGIELIQSTIERNVVSTGLQLPISIVYSVFPIAALLVCIRLVPIIIDDVKGILSKKTILENNGGDKR